MQTFSYLTADFMEEVIEKMLKKELLIIYTNNHLKQRSSLKMEDTTIFPNVLRIHVISRTAINQGKT